MAAAKIHGPSYISFETALNYYGLIPERVETTISVVDRRQLNVSTPLGSFFYRSQSRKLFSAGMSAVDYEEDILLIANPEKALLDTLAWKNLKTNKMTDLDVYNFVCDGIRIDEDSLNDLRISILKRLSSMYRNLAPQRLVRALEHRKRNIK